MDTALSIIMAEAELLKEILSDGKHDSTLSALQSLLERKRSSKTNKDGNLQPSNLQDSTSASMFGGWIDSWNGCLSGGFSFDEIFCGGDLGLVDGGNKGISEKKDDVDATMIHTVGDLKSNEELVYAVGINPTQERITVAFRGSVTKTDFLTDAKIRMIQVPDPREFLETGRTLADDSKNKIGVHQGFYDYLFGTKNKKSSKYEEIMAHVKELFDAKPSRRKNYKLYVTGHSLGGALATLFGFYASASSLPLPVTVVSVASPRVGNIAFASAFIEFESQGKIRHLRIANHKDPVTLSPTVSSKRALTLASKTLSPLGYLALKATGNEGGDDEIYYHTGIKLKLRNEAQANGQLCELSYSGASILSGSSHPEVDDKEDMSIIDEYVRKSSLRRKSSSMPSAQDIPLVAYHYGTAYSERMALVESDLAGLTLNKIYREKTSGT